MTHEEIIAEAKPVFDLIDSGVLPVIFAKGAAWSRFVDGSHGNKKLSPADFDAWYTAQWGREYISNHRHIPAQKAFDAIMAVVDSTNEVKRQELRESSKLFEHERGFIEHHWEVRGVEISDYGVWTCQTERATCDYSMTAFLSYLHEQLLVYNRTIPKDEKGRPVFPTLSAEGLAKVLANKLHEKQTARITNLRGLLAHCNNGVNINEAATWFLETYFIQPNPANIAAFKHMLWMVKRKIWGLDIPSPLFFCFHSKRQHLGKTTLIRKLCSGFDWAYSGKGSLTNLLTANDYKAMVRGKYLLDFQELAISSKIKGRNGESVDAAVVAELKSAISSDVIEGRMMYGESNSTERQTAVFASSTNIHIFDVCNDPTGMRRYWEFHLDPPEGYNQEFYLEANEFFDNIQIIYQAIEENNNNGFFYPGAPEWPAMRAIQDSYAKQDTFTLFLKMRQWEISQDAEEGYERIALSALLKTFNRFLLERGEREWRSGNLLNLLAQSRDICPDMSTDEKTQKITEYFWIKKP